MLDRRQTEQTQDYERTSLKKKQIKKRKNEKKMAAHGKDGGKNKKI